MEVVEEEPAASTSGPHVLPFARPAKVTYMPPSIRETGTLRPAAEWYPAWMQYRRREDNYIFWQDKFMRCSLDIPGELFSGSRAMHTHLRVTRSLSHHNHPPCLPQPLSSGGRCSRPSGTW